MTKKEGRTKKPPLKKPQWTEGQHYNAIMLEKVESQMSLVIEHMNGVEQRLIRAMDEKFDSQNQRFDMIEAVLKQHSQKLQVLENKMGNMEHRMDHLEQKIDKVIEKVEDHDKDIKELKVASL